MKHTTLLFWTCRCKSRPYHRLHETECIHCGDLRDVCSASSANIAELLLYYSEFLSPDETSAFERVCSPHSNEIWMLVTSDGPIDIVKVSLSMLEIEEEYARLALEAGTPWDDEAMDYDWTHDDSRYAIFGIDTTIPEVV